VNRLYTSLLVVHVLVAILGLGSIASIAIVAASAGRAGRRPAEALTWLGPLLRYSAFSLGAMLVTGILLGAASAGAVYEAWWFRGSALLLVPTGALHGRARRAVRLGLATEGSGDLVVRRVARLAYAMCALIAVIAGLMEVKPF
jgi:hypothetical protein